jgi:hypothetical protein
MQNAVNRIIQEEDGIFEDDGRLHCLAALVIGYQFGFEEGQYDY